MPSTEVPQPLRVLGSLHWAFDEDLYVAAQSCRTWAYWGSSRGTLEFAIQPLGRKPAGIRLVLDPVCPGVNLVSLCLKTQADTRRFDNECFSFNPSCQPSATTSFYDELTDPTEITSACFELQCKELLTLLNRGGNLVLEFAFEESQPGAAKPFIDAQELYAELHSSDPEDLADLRLKAAAHHAHQLAAEAKSLRLRLETVYDSHSWKLTKPFRESGQWLRSKRAFQVIAKAPNALRRSLRAKRSLLRFGSNPVDIIIPVHDAFASTRNCITSILSSAPKTKYELIVVNDASTDSELIVFLQDLAAHDIITLLTNERNLGYTASIRRAIALHPDRDVLLLNSDCQVANDWLDRLVKAAYSERTIATVTPFSNNATICSYPKAGLSNQMPGDCTVAELDELFKRVNAGIVHQLPTAIGYCMYVKRKCMERAGDFDSLVFPGYGEENDFAARMEKSGYKNVLAADCFVFHDGEQTFQTSSKAKKFRAYDALTKIHPEYERSLRDFLRKNPLELARHRVDIERLRRLNKPIILHIHHGLGGGTGKHVRELAELFKEDVASLELTSDREIYYLSWSSKSEGMHLKFNAKSEFLELLVLLKSLPIRRLHIHQISTFLPNIRRLVLSLGLPFDFTVHDFHAICPQIALCDYKRQYCGQPDEDGCNNCIAINKSTPLSIQAWRRQHSWLVNQADRVFVPSWDTLMRFKPYFPEREYILAYHPDSELESSVVDAEPRPILDGEPIRIAVLGALGPEKGADVLEECALDAIARKLPLEFHLLGYAYRYLEPRPKAAFIAHGPYQDEDLVDLLHQIRPHLVWFPALVPETYSYTLSACLATGVPVVASNLGAYSERLSGRAYSWIAPWDQGCQQWNDFFIQIAERHLKPQMTPVPITAIRFPRSFTYGADYLAPIKDVQPPPTQTSTYRHSEVLRQDSSNTKASAMAAE